LAVGKRRGDLRFQLLNPPLSFPGKGKKGFAATSTLFYVSFAKSR
jgi:hypothetical protein